ncbi:MAG: hypothetical protein ACHQU0_02320 [Candidatus Paceibacteria bacterium]
MSNAQYDDRFPKVSGLFPDTLFQVWSGMENPSEKGYRKIEDETEGNAIDLTTGKKVHIPYGARAVMG